MEDVATQPIWLVALGGVITLILVPIFNMIKPFILTAEQRAAHAEKLRVAAGTAESAAMVLLREERDAAVLRYENEFKQRMELVGEHKFVARMLAEMEVRHQECEESNRALTQRMARIEGMVPGGAAAIVPPNAP